MDPLDHPRYDGIKAANHEMNDLVRRYGTLPPANHPEFIHARESMDRALREFKKSLRQEFRQAQVSWFCTLATYYWDRFNAAIVGSPSPIRPLDPR
jgi:hypothetical protein